VKTAALIWVFRLGNIQHMHEGQRDGKHLRCSTAYSIESTYFVVGLLGIS